MAWRTEPRLILHITTRAAWDAARTAGSYRGDTLESDGFIHFSDADQVVATTNRFFRGTTGLVLLVVQPAKLEAELRRETAPDGAGVFPHLYGPLNLDAVVREVPLEPWEPGAFRLPS